jgi:hypothetical protein
MIQEHELGDTLMLGIVSRHLLALTCAAVAGTAVLTAPAVADTPAVAAAPPTLAGAWAPLNRCPVDDPAMLTATGTTTVASCLASAAAGGSITLGGSTLTTGLTNLQFGVVTSGATFTIVPPSGGALAAAPVTIPGGLLGLMCPSNIPFVSGICRQLAGGALNTVTATVEAAGAPSEFNLAAGLGVGQPILRLPVKIRLSNPFLGSNCFIGSNTNPIVLRPANLTQPALRIVRFDPNGAPNPAGVMGYAVTEGASQGDSTFAVPGASGCGLFGLLDGAVNLRQGLPSPAGANSIVLNNATTQFGGHFLPATAAPTQGRQLADHWHAAVVS